MEVESNKGSPLKSEPLKEGFHPPREDRDTPRANSQDECSNPGTDSHEASNKMVECSDEDDEAVDGQKCKVCGDNVGSLFGSIVCVPCKVGGLLAALCLGYYFGLSKEIKTKR